ncbi:hypothetical protein CMI38_01180 [Candidatus Pacearchaeota archaeon]|nr:hypothetical protein [Candidatus Pacearchaeota archaeon]|tara:strand:+ start:224 stop:1009 length:786 start_codon:yes stop_codon:yes gene_type:complete
MRYKNISLLLTILLLLTIVPTILADTEFKITAPSEYRISLFIREEGELTTTDSFHKNVDGSGELTLTTSASHEYLDVTVTLKKGTNQIKTHKFESVKSGDVYTITMVPGIDPTILSSDELAASESEETIEEEDTEVEEVVEETIEEEIEEETEAQASPTTGLAVSDLMPSGKFSYFLWVVIGVSALLFAILVARKKIDLSKKSPPENIDDKRLLSAEKRIKEAQDEINKIKNRSNNEKRLKDAQERFKKDQEEIKKLRGDL